MNGSLLSEDDQAVTDSIVLQQASALAGGGSAFLLVLGEDETLVVRATHGEHTRQHRGLTYRLRQPYHGELFSSGKPLLLQHSPDIFEGVGVAPSLHPGGCSIIIPLAVTTRNMGVLVISRAPQAPGFTVPEAEAAESFAAHAALAMEFGRASADLRRLAVLEDRDRIAADLHDLIIQRLFAVGLALQSPALGLDNAREQRRVNEALDQLDDIIRSIRTSISSLQHDPLVAVDIPPPPLVSPARE